MHLWHGSRFYKVLVVLSSLVSSGGCGPLSSARGQDAKITEFPAGFVDPAYCEDIVFAPNGRAVVLIKPEGAVKICDLITGGVETLPNPYKARPRGSKVAFSKEGQVLAVAYGPHGIVIWDMIAKREIGRIPLKRVAVEDLVLIDNDRTLLALVSTSEYDLLVNRWEVRSGELRDTVNLGKTPVLKVLSPDGRHAIFRLPIIEYAVFDLASGLKCFDLKPGGGWVFSHDGSKLISCEDSRLSIREVHSGKELMRFRASPEFSGGYPPLPSVSSDGKLLAVQGYPDSHVASVISLETGKHLGRVECGPPLSLCNVVRLSPDGRTMATQTNGVDAHDQPVKPILKLWKLPASW